MFNFNTFFDCYQHSTYKQYLLLLINKENEIKKVIAMSALVASATFSSAAFAQAKSFQGFSVGINGSFVGNTTELTSCGI